MRPYESKKDFFLSLLSELMTTLVTFFFLVLTLDENYNLVTVDTRVQIGWFIIVLIILVVLKSIALVVYPAVRGIMKLFASKKKPEDSEEESEAPARKNEVELKANVQPQTKITPNVAELEKSRLNTSVRKILEDETPEKVKKG
jgi:flagellar biosynthesis/type III secretory pathway M-ring protein FliF/YscJ